MNNARGLKGPLALLVGLLAFQLLAGTVAAQVDTIRVGNVCSVSPLVYYVAREEGFLEKHGIDAEKHCFSGGSAGITALMAGGIDAMTATYEHVQKLRAQGQDVRAVAGLFDRIGYWLMVRQDSPLQSLEDLKGKRIGITSAGSLSDMTLRYFLLQNGIDPVRDVTIIAAGSGATMLAAIEHGRVDAGMVNQPTKAEAEADGRVRVLFDPNTQEYAGIVMVMRGDFIEKNPDLVRRFIAAIYEARQAIDADPEIAFSALVKTFPESDPEILRAVVNDYLPFLPQGLYISEESAANVIASLQVIGALPEPVPYEEAVDLSWLPAE